MRGVPGVRSRVLGRWARPRALRAPAACAAAALALAGCATAGTAGVTVSGHRLTIYASEPPGLSGGQVAADVIDAERLAFDAGGGRVGDYTVAFRVLHEPETSDDARAAIEDQSAIAYLGEIVPGTSQVSLEITNQLDLLQVSPTDTAVYLTQATPSVPGSPDRFYPSLSSYHRTFARVVPTTAQEARAIVARMRALGAGSVYVASDGGLYGSSIAAEVRADAPAEGLTLAGDPASAGAVFYGSSSPGAAAAELDRAAAAGRAALFVPSALYSDSLAAALSPAAQQRLYVSVPGFAPGSEPAAAAAFERAFAAHYGHAPVPQAVFGYEAMAAVLAVLREAGSRADQRATVVRDFLAIRDRASVLGTYSLHDGDTTLAPFIFARVRDGRLSP
ncbi:MAG TPA: hypothetical protein VKV27_12115 [Solirubrobacteraceae bacterium]|nr:hypothetical protein [Solirubrobacteraceae bacterium]